MIPWRALERIPLQKSCLKARGLGSYTCPRRWPLAMDCVLGSGACNLPSISKQSTFHRPRASLQRKYKCEPSAASTCHSWRWVYWPSKGTLGRAPATSVLLGKLFEGKERFIGVWGLSGFRFCPLSNSPTLQEDLVVVLRGPMSSL